MLLYAAQADVVAVWDPARALPGPDALDGALRAASRRVRHATRAARYDVGTSGLPTDPDVVAAFRDATVAQCLLWMQNDLSPDVLPQQVVSKSMGGRSVTLTSDSAVRVQAAKELCDDAVMILSQAGLVGQPWAY